jgi:hypothetical protein
MSIRLKQAVAQEALAKLLVGGRLSSIHLTMTSFNLTIEVPTASAGVFTHVNIIGSDDSSAALEGSALDEPADRVDKERLQLFGPSYQCLGSDIASVTLSDIGELALHLNSERSRRITIGEIYPAQLDVSIWSVEVADDSKKLLSTNVVNAIHFVREGREVCCYRSDEDR